MKKRIIPVSSSSQPPLSETSRHELHTANQKENHIEMESNQFNFSNMRLKFFVSKLIKKLKYLAPPLQTPEGVIEEWERDLQNQQNQQSKTTPELYRKQTLSQQIFNRHTIFQWLFVLQGVLIILFSWTVTVSFVFKVNILVQIPILVTIFNIIWLLLKAKIIIQQYEDENHYQVQILQDLLEPIFLLSAAIFMILRYYIDSDRFEYFLMAYQFFCVFVQWRKIGKYFEYLTLYAEHNKKRKQLRIIELFCFTLVMAHIFALIMYSMTYFCPTDENTWVHKANLQDKPWYVLYIYSYYWANTTMVTVGYGDLTPNNFFEALIVTLIEIVGTAIFGYMINVIGITVNQIQKKNVEFEQHQSTIFKLKDHYQLSRQLCYKMKSDLKKKESQMIAKPLKNNQQSQFLDYIDSSLKNDFVLETNMKVIKKSIFFLTHFTVNCQNQIALKLIRCIYKPNECINFHQNGQHQMVIIYSGKVNIFCRNLRNNRELLKLARVIKPQQGKASTNVYGYSSLILNRKINLKAVTEQIATAYILKRGDLLQSIDKNILDFQSFNELRERMLQCSRAQEIEAPAIIQQENHFMPNLYLLIKKSKNTSQYRSKIPRGTRKLNLTVVTLKHYQNKTMLCIPNERKEDEDWFQLNTILQLEEKGTKKQMERTNKKPFDFSIIDQAKNFEKFLKNYNLNIIANQYQKVCLRKSYLRRMILGMEFKSTKSIKN